MRKRSQPARWSAALALPAALIVAGPAAGNTFTPTRFDDPPAGKCKPDNCSLREALRAANKQNGPDEVVLGKGTYEMEILPVEGQASGDFDIFTAVVLRGKGSAETKIDGNGIDRVLTNEPVGGSAVTVQGLTVTGGDGGAQRPNGGGIWTNAKRFTLKNAVVKKNEAVSRGGGLFAGSTDLTIRDSTIAQNTAIYGGGLSSSATKLTIRDSTIARNIAAEGGGLDLRSDTPAPVTVIRSSTISGNSAAKGGGILADGLPNDGVDPSLELVNSTVAGNLAGGEGGGIMADNAATVTLDNSTVAYNQANWDGVGAGDGGGVYQHSGAVFGLGDALIAANTVGQGGAGPQCDGTFSTADGLVRQSQSSGTCSFSGAYTIVDNPLIGPLADNGGPTKTVKLLTGSPAIGFAQSCPARDQRGEPRPSDDCDSGSYERMGP